ncbi:histidine phosphatase family protein [Hydrogenophaga sp.]|jgi:broad specificity phosphatase PhoE|uniref:histidine phosphatase family protein n=1 Tax=Hydrogenophaga sp. TaxID=1904254 RepID=UPI00260B93D0|nr:histidine phosphatase family protein [Hydrogenophaga sp.]MDM7949422.1 histidine phosphatase family protein [Hydrogenophaga sp.]
MRQTPRRRFTSSLLGLALGAPLLARAQSTTEAADFWTLLRQGGNVLLMRHAQTESGIGDPPNFRIGDCSTQRNLNDVGREQSRRVAAAFQRERIVLDEVRSSAWCRCVDTAELAFGRHTVWSPINSFFQQNGRETQTAEVLRALKSFKAPRNLVLVTHQVNISALTGGFVAMGEILLTRPGQMADGRLRVLARQSF